LDGLLDAFVSLKKDRRDLSLVIAGNDDFFFRRLKAEAGRTGRASGVVFLPSPDDRAVAALHRGAAAYIAPSFTEGFGLPPLEAMSVGVPVASSGGGSFPEVLGEAAERFNPHRAEDMARVIGRLLDDDVLREKLAVAGREQAARWSWKEAAKITLATYRKVLEKKVE
jgi:glycosyltransferase involved in cell wall biosynthesis